MMTNLLHGAHVANKLFSTIARLRLLLVMFLTLTVTTNAWAETETITADDATYTNSTHTWSQTSCTVVQSKGSASSAVSSTYPDRWYQGHQIKFTPKSGYTITKIVLAGSSNYNGQTIKASVGAISSSSNTTTWTGNITSSSSVTLTMGKQFRFGSVTITYTSGGSGSTTVDPDVTFSNGEYTIGGAALDLSTLWESNSTGAVTYSVTNANGTGATINGTSFTATAAGSCTVRATQAATASHNTITKTATITVIAAAGGGGDGECIWQLVTNVSDLAVGDEIVITASTANYALSTTQRTSNRQAVAITKSDDAITINENVQVITLATASATKTNTFAFYVGTGFLYASSSGSNELKTTAYPEQNGDWYLEIKNTGVASITAQGDKTRKVMQFNLNNNNPAIFACYSSASQTSLAIYKKVCTAEPTVTLNPNGGSFASTPDGWIQEGSNNYKKEDVTGAITLPTPTKTGYDFDGWYDGETKVNSPYTPSETVTLTAKWTAIQTTITLNANGGSGNTASVKATYDSSTLNPSSITNPTKTGYTFGGWYSGEGGTGSLVINTSGKLQANVSGFTGTNSVWKATTNETLYAKWTPSVYTITYKDQGNATFSGTHESGNPTQHTYGTETTLKGATKTGYTFGGWYKEAICTNKVTSLGATEYTANITLYAQWTANTYTVKFDGNGSDGGSMTDQSFTYGQSQALSANAFTRTNYSFKHWTINQDGTGISYTDKQSVSNLTAENGATVTLYAQWTPTYTITWLANEQVHHTQTAVEGTTLQMPSTPADGSYSCDDKVFVGWTENQISGSTNTKPADLFTNKSGTLTVNKTYYAVFATAEGVASTDYTMITDINNLTDGNYVIAYGYNTTTPSIILKATTNDETTLVATSASPSSNKYQNPAAENIWTIKKNGTTYTLYNETTSKYVQANTTPALLLADANPTNFNIEYSTDHWKIKINGNTSYQLVGYTNASGNYFQTKSSASSSYKIQLYKNTSTVSYSDYTTTCVKLPDPVWEGATIDKTALSVNCGERSPMTGQNGAAKITFPTEKIYNFTKDIKIEATSGFLVSTSQSVDANYKSSVFLSPLVGTANANTFYEKPIYVRAEAPAQSDTDLEGTITIKNSNGETLQTFSVTADVTCTQCTITWSVSGDTEIIEPTTFYAGGNWELPENPTFECNGREFVGWTNTEILQPQNIAPNVLYKEQSDFPTIESNTTFYAVFAEGGTDDGSGTATVTDILNRDLTGITETQYSNWSDKKATSSAVYAGNSAGGNESIQLRSDKSSAGIITTTSGGKARNVTVVWNSSTTSGRVLNIYGKNSAYSAVTDLYGNNAGTLIGSITYNTSTTLTISNDYEYIGIRSASGALYLTSISIDWETDDAGSGNATTYTSYTTSCADIKGIRIEGPTTTTFNEGDEFFFDGKVYAINNDDSETDVTNSPNLRFVYDMHKTGTQTVTVNYLGKSATYEITINAVDKWQITWNVSGVTNTGLGPKEVAKGTAIGKLPQPTAIPAGCTSKEFRGWTESNTVHSDGSSIEWITEETVPTANTTYYAVFATNSGEGSGDGNYVKLTDTPADLSGEYLIVYEDTENNYDGAKAFDGGLATLDAASNTISVTINGNTIESTDDTDAAKFTIAPYNGGYSIKSASNKYIGRTTDVNELDESTSTSYTNTITITEGYADIIGSGGAYLRYNKTSSMNNGKETGLRFRYYKSTTYADRQPIALYKKSNSYASYTDYTTGCHDVTITYYGFTGGYTTKCAGSDLNVITQRVNSAHTIPNCTEITDPTTLGRTFLGTWKDQNGKERKPGDNFIVTENITFYAQWTLNTSGNTTLPTDVEDLANTDIVVTGGNTLTLGAGTTTIKSLTLKGGIQADGSYKMPIIYIPDNATLKRKSDIIYLDLVVNAKNYYPFAVPFRAKNGSAQADWDYVGYINSVLKEAATYRTHFVIKTYNGANRAENGENRDANWVIVNRDTYLEPGIGYMITAMTYAGKDTVTMRIPMRVSDDWFAGGEKTTINDVTRNAISVTAHTGEAAEEHQRHAGWNFVASPYLSQFAGNNVENNGAFINGEILIQPGFDYGGYDVPYVTIPAYDFSYYEQVKLSDVTLSPEYSFFVQIGKNGTMTFETAGRQQAPAHLAARAAEQPVKMGVDLILSDDNHSDQTGIIICDRYTDAYEIGHDLEKMFGSAYNLSVYTLMADNTPLAFQALAIQNSMQVIPVGYRTPAQGEYTFALNEATSDTELLNEQYEQLILVDYETGALTNMLNNEYTFYSDRTQSNNRFALYAVPRQNTTTDLPNAIGNEEVKKVIYNDHFYILREGKVFNGAGQIVK